MKKLILLSLLIIASLDAFSQEKNEFRLYYGTSDSKLLHTPDLDGASSQELENFNEFGFRYLREISNNFSLETGINYTSAELEIMLIGSLERPTKDFELISVPVFVNYTFWKFFFLNAGPILDLETSQNVSDSQSGFGYGLGVGGQYNFDNFSLFLNPNFKRHSVIPFEKEDHHRKLTEFGIQFGVGYRF